MPQTGEYGLWFEAPRGEAPGHSLRAGGPSGQGILAEQVEDELSRIDTDVADVQGRVTEIEDKGVLGWTYIAHDTDSGGAFSIDVTAGGTFPAGTFDMLRLHGRFGLDDEGTIRLRINGIAGDHVFGYTVQDADTGNFDIVDHGGGQNQWVLAHGATALTNNFTCTIYHTSGTNAVTYQSSGSRISGTANVHRRTEAWGALSSGRLVSSLEIRPFTATANEIDTLWWWLEGFKIP